MATQVVAQVLSKPILHSRAVLAEQLFVKVIALEDGDKPDTMCDELLNSLPRYVRSS